MTKQFFAIENIGIGEIKQSILTEAQFQQVFDSSWALMDGRSIVGSDLATLTGATNLPDARGVFLRNKNNGRADGNENPDGEITEGNLQVDEVTSHAHARNPNGVAELTDIFPAAGSSGVNSGYAAGNQTSYYTNTASTGGNETRPKNITVNTYIKINKQ